MEVDLGGVDVEPEPNDAAFEEIAESTEHPLERKLALAHEFMQIGDMEGARDLLDEVYASATGPMKDRARELLDEFG
jgi:pilus assembly protein FimV